MLLGTLGATPYQSWAHGRSWRFADGTYLVLERSPALTVDGHDRCSPGLNHLAFRVDADLDHLVAEAGQHGWQLLFPDLHPWAGGPQHRAAYLADTDGFEVELVVVPPSARGRAGNSGDTEEPAPPS